MTPVGWFGPAEFSLLLSLTCSSLSLLNLGTIVAAGRQQLGSDSGSESESTSHSSKIARSSDSELNIRIP